MNRNPTSTNSVETEEISGSSNVNGTIGYQRDFSFYAGSHGGSGGKFHLVGGHDGASKCGRARLLNDTGMPLTAIPEILRCKICLPLPRCSPNKNVNE